MDWLAILKDYQDLISNLLVGVIGFGGVILTLRHNARLTRQQRERELADERASLRGALRAELAVLRNSFQDRLDTVAPRAGRGVGFTMPRQVIADMYDQLIEKLGLLTHEEAERVLVAYLFARELPDKVREFKWGQDLSVDDDNEPFIVVPPQAVQHVLELHRVRLGRINEAIDALTAATSADH